MTIRVAVAGAGLIGQAHIERIAAEPRATLAAIVDPAPGAAALAARHGVPHFTDLAEALRTASPDGVILATPNRLHVPHGLAAVAAGVPMLVEKPVSDDLASARRLVDAAESAGVPILVGHHRRHSPTIRRARAIRESGRLGRLTAVNGFCWFLKPPGYFEGATSWRREPGGGVILINLIHVIDDLRNICGDIAAVQAATSNTARGFPVEDTAAILLHFRDGALGTLTISDSAPAPWSWELTSGENKAYPFTDQSCYFVAGTKASLSIPRLEVWSHGDGAWMDPIASERLVVPEQDPLVLQLRHFLDIIAEGATPVIDGREGMRTLETTLAVTEAAASGGIVRLP